MLSLGILYTASDDRLSFFKLFLADNSIVHPFYNNPILLILSDGFMRTNPSGLSLMAYGCTCVDIVYKYLIDH